MRSLRSGFRGLTGGGKKVSPQGRFLTILLTMFGIGLLLYALTTR